MEFDTEGMEPPLLRDTKVAPRSTMYYSGRKFFGLTQASKQLRSEFRPVWLRDSSVRIELQDLDDFISTFYSKAEEFRNAPKMLLISWNHDSDEEQALFDITPLLCLRAFCPTFEASFVCHDLIEGVLPNVDYEECGHSIHCECLSECDHDEAHGDGIALLRMEYRYTEALNEILAHNNENWLTMLRKDHLAKTMTIECTADVDAQHLTVCIRFRESRAPSTFTNKTMYSGAVQFLHSMGLLDLERDHMSDFVVGEATGKFINYDGLYMPTYNQVEISAGTVFKDEPNTGKASHT
jgi:hypothetical protein